jgi:putative nucleotidyltransferase with HDIG domain
MDFLSFKKIRLFKSQTAPPTKNHAPRPGPKPEPPGTLAAVVSNPFVLAFLFVLALAYLISYVPSHSLPEPKEGSIAAADIVAPADLTIEDTEATDARRQDARAQTLPVYVFNSNVLASTELKVRQFFAYGRDWLARTSSPSRKVEALRKEITDGFDIEPAATDLSLLIRLGFPASLEDALTQLLSVPLSRGVIMSRGLFTHREPERGLTLVKGREERTVKAADMPDLREAKDELSAAAQALELPVRTKACLINLGGLFLSSNVTFDQELTQAHRDQAAARVEPVFYKIKKGKVIVRKGDEVTAGALRQVRIINANLRTTPSWLVNFVGTFLILGLIFITIWYYLKSLLGYRRGVSMFGLLGIVLTLSLLLYKLGLFLSQVFSQNTTFPLLTRPESYAYSFPFQFGVLTFAFLATMPVSLIYAIVNSLVVGYLFGADFFLMIFCLMGGLAALYGVKYFQRQKRTSTLQAGLFIVAPVNVFIIIALQLVRGGPGGGLVLFFSKVLMGVLGGILGSALAFVLLPLFETLFGFVTQPRLLDLTNSDTPILRQLALEAPGSYHHALLVATLAEKAAEAIKLDPLLVKAGALYHDIGKLKRPEYFIENRVRNVDTHRDLTPAMSALVIINHVKEGAEMARRLRLPRKIRDIIEQHHGSSLVRFFYQKAKEKYDPEMHDIPEEQFRYPGPPPRSKEAALIMLADAVEAASKTLRTPTEIHFKRVISAIFEGFIQDGQLDDCDFSLKELKTVASSFLETLDSIYHHRVDYPGYEFGDKPKREEKTNGHARNNKQPEEIPS